jgi:calcineurin-like phosphoesterase family protein
MKYFISDVHFNHKGIMRHASWRSQFWPSVKDMNEGIINLWNKRIKPEDTVYFLGDLFMGKSSKTKSIIKKLNGKKIIVLGNHDRTREFYLDNGFDEAYEGPIEIDIRWNDLIRRVRLNHFPYFPNFFEFLYYLIFDRKMLRCLDRHPKNDGMLLLHGHVHTRWFLYKNMINIGLDSWVPGGFDGPRILSETDIVLKTYLGG